MTPKRDVPSIQMRKLAKTYFSRKLAEEKIALKAIDLDVPQGSFFALLGPNGAGKSTMINIMSGLTVKSSGEMLICGYNIDTHMREARTSIGVVPQELVLDTFFTVRQALELHAGYYGVPKAKRRTDEIIAAMGLTDKADARPRSLSGGMRRRLLIAKALVHNPPVLVLDEPTAGVDVELRTQLWAYVRELNRQGTTILLTTHYLEEAEELCDRIAIIDRGELVACDDKRTLMRGFDSKRLVVFLKNTVEDLPPPMREEGWEKLDNHSLSISYKPSKTDIERLLSMVREHGLHISDITTKDTDLEEVFMHFTRKVA
ncbi:MAG: ABC transporter ATP-binding protein [Rickettsiales bacterium]|nr:ABC transporter ATP-binding protein [Rickettsiales bacterium]